MESPMSNKENTCVVCFRNIDIHAVGDCDHYDRVCYVCSARLRILCDKCDCPICRKDLGKVIFSRHKIPYSVLSQSSYPSDSKYGISFHDDFVQAEYRKLLEQECTVCPTPIVFNSFGQLKDHLRKEHQLFYCELCVEHLKLFTFERKIYNRRELGQHRRVGDPDNTSHKGHPRCQFCDQRYVDKDELYRHLRRYHFFCHFCEADDKFEFYGNYNYLRKHFQEKHFLCEEDACKDEQFTSVFKTDIDLKAHVSAKHSQGLTKQQAKQARTLEFEFTIVPREYNGIQSVPGYEGRNGNRRGRNPRRGVGRDSRPYGERQYEDSATNNTNHSYYVESEHEINTNCEKEFPTLSNQGNSSDFHGKKITITATAAPRNYRKTFSVSNEDDFPSLSKPNDYVIGNHASKVTVTSDACAPSTTLRFSNKENSASKSQTPNLSLKFSTKPTTNRDDDYSDNWGSVKYQPPKNIEEEFPTLVTTKKGRDNCTSTMTIPVYPNSAWGKKGKKEIVERKPPEHFEVVKSKSQKKKEKNALTVLKPNSEKQPSPPVDNNNSFRDLPSYVESDYNGTTNSTVRKTEENDISEDTKPKPIRKPANLVASDFPPLSVPTSEKPTIPPGLKLPKKVETKMEPPPGYYRPVKSPNISLSLLAQQLSVPTVTEGRNLQRLPTKATYFTPENFQERNRILISDILEILGDDESSFNQFKQLSKLFRQGEVSAAEYYSECSAIFGKERFFRILAELLVLLPDINKQQELLAVHYDECKKESRNIGTVPKHVLFMVCASCQQVLSNGDFKDHMLIHKPPNEMPTPSFSSLSTDNMEWGKK